MTGAPVVAFLVILNSDSCVAGSGRDRATAHPVPLVSISFAATGVKARVVALIFKGALSATVKLEPRRAIGPRGRLRDRQQVGRR